MFATHAASNTFLDIMVLVTPIPFLGMLRLVGKSKAGLITLFTLGCMYVYCSGHSLGHRRESERC
jgi:hypothetical protein